MINMYYERKYDGSYSLYITSFLQLYTFLFYSLLILRLIPRATLALVRKGGGERVERNPLITGVLMSEIAHPHGTLAVSCHLSSRGELISPISHCHVDRR